ncbi:MAG: ethylbenzene dehydrogenase-related protein [Myxococcaceae bacterium]
MMRRILSAALLVPPLLLSQWSCTDALTPRYAELEDAGLTDDGGDAGEPQLGDGMPADTFFSFGVTDNAGNAPQSAPFLTLSFHGGTPSADAVIAKRLTSPITVDGNASDWAEIPPSVVPLQNRGEPIGMSKMEWDTEWTLLGSTPPLFDFNITNAIVRAAWDDTNIYFLVEWADATKSMNRESMVYLGGQWIRSTENEDRLYFGFNINSTFPGFDVLGCSAACHMRKNLGDVSMAGRAYRFRMHTLAAGQLGDTWSWRAHTTNGMSAADDNYWDETGRKTDSAIDFVVTNRKALMDGGSVPLFMSEAGINANPEYIYAPDAGLSPKAIPYDGTEPDAGARIPGYVFQRASANRADVKAKGVWLNGKWTVELTRALTTNDSKDVQFPLQ